MNAEMADKPTGPTGKQTSGASGAAADLLAKARKGERLALARLMSMVERGVGSFGTGNLGNVTADREAVRELAALAFSGSANSDSANPSGVSSASHTVGITGAPGSGKSSITSELLVVARERGEKVAVIAVDPSSPFTGGAILGDRVRMGSHTSDEGVYIRSMASRGQLGGLSLAVPLGARVLAAAGWPWVLIETVGVGQVEVDIAAATDTTVVVLNPGWGDSVQANKAGLMEIADIFVINKSDRPGVSQTRMDIVQMLELSTGPTGPGAHGDSGSAGEHVWEPPIVETVGTTGQGASELFEAITAHRDYLVSSGLLDEHRQARADNEFSEILRQHMTAQVEALSATAAGVDIKRKLMAGQLDPHTAADKLIELTDLG